MSQYTYKTLDANEAVARVAYLLSETIAIYPITPSSPMAESCDEWRSMGKRNAWGALPSIVQMQSEAGAAGAVHGMLQSGALSTTFTASQGLLLMIPAMFKIAGELLPFVMHVTARTLATHALSIFGDHSDVMACRSTGVAMLCSNSVQEAQDMALISHAATLRARIPFLHFFDGFRTSHEVSKIAMLDEKTVAAMVNEEALARYRASGMTPDAPTIRGTAQNPDAFFQAREACSPYYAALPGIVAEEMEKLGALTGRHYNLFDYHGHPEAEQVVIVMGSGADVAHEYVDWALEQGEAVGVLKPRLFRPWSVADFAAALPASVRTIAVLDRSKEPGAVGEPLKQEVVAALHEAAETGVLRQGIMPKVVGGRFGLSSKEFTPAMVRAVFENIASPTPKKSFTIGINDDVSGSSLPWDEGFDIEPQGVSRAMFFGLGADGTVGANKNSIKIIGEETDNFAQGYFVYDSKKSGSMTTSHLRFGPKEIRSSYLITKANFIACHQEQFLRKIDMLEFAAPGAVFLLNTTADADHVWARMPDEARRHVVEKGIRCYGIDAYRVAQEAGMGGRINTIMQTCFFAISGVLPREEAIAKIKESIHKSYVKKGQDVVEKNWKAVDQTLARLFEFPQADTAATTFPLDPPVPEEAPDFVRRVTGLLLAGQGDRLPVSAFPPDGVWPTGTARWEKRNIGQEVPVWEPDLCIQCNKCVMVCPHATIRAKFYDPTALTGAPDTFKAADFRSQDVSGGKYTIQVAVEDCTGCSLCVQVCPAKDKANPRRKAINMQNQAELRDAERLNWNFFLDIPESDRTAAKMEVKSAQFLQPLFEFSGACGGCGETPYLKLLTQLYGDRLVIANATGCSSIYGGNLPTTPYTVNADGRGPVWANSLFEDNAEFGLGIRLGVNHHSDEARRLLRAAAPQIGDELVTALLNADQSTEAGIQEQRARVALLKAKPADHHSLKVLLPLADYLVRKSVWIIGGDGWAYDIGFGGLDHVLSGSHDVNVLVLDTQVYSNTGGQASKSTPMSAVAKFAAGGKESPRKDLGLMLMSYGHIYVASVAMGAKDGQTMSAFHEAESYAGPSIIIAYSHCIAHGYSLTLGMEQQKLAVNTGFWPLYRFDPRRARTGGDPLKVDSGKPGKPVQRFTENETRFRMLASLNPGLYEQLTGTAQEIVNRRYEVLQRALMPQAGTETVE